MTTTAPARPIDRFSPWLHAASAGIAAGVFPYFAQPYIFYFMFAWWLILVQLAVLVGVLVGLSALFARKPRVGRAVLLGLIILVVAVLATWPVGEIFFGRIHPLVLLFTGIVGASFALLLHYPGIARIVGAGALVAVVVGAVAVYPRADPGPSDMEQGMAMYGSTIRPYVTTVDEYTQNFEPRADYRGNTIATYWPSDSMARSAGEAQAEDFHLSTEVAVDVSTENQICSAPLMFDPIPAEETAVSCEAIGEVWHRASATSVELAVVVDGFIPRASAQPTIAPGVLDDAIAHAEPMSDRYYRHLLLGEEGEYIQELDGRR